MICTVRTVRAPNPGPMTLTGTNTYVVEAGDACWIVDPGPEDRTHLRAVAALVGPGPQRPAVHAIVLTHHHRDHSGGAGALARMVARTHAMPPPVLAADPARVAGSRPLPDRLERDGAVIGEVIRTPGHTADSVSILLANGSLLTGDTVLGDGATPVIMPGDGDLASYLDSLQTLRARTRTGDATAILPGHGEPVGIPDQDRGPVADRLLERLIAHRRERVDQVRAARRDGALTMPQLVRAVYGPDPDPALVEPMTWNLRAALAFLRTHG